MPTLPNEKSSLLPSTTGISDEDDNNEGEYRISGYEGDYEDSSFPTLDKRRDSFSQMKMVTHNDPLLLSTHKYESAEDFSKFLGSTSLLKNGIEQGLAAKDKKNSFHRSRSSSFTMTLEVSPEAGNGDGSHKKDSSSDIAQPVIEYYNSSQSKTKFKTTPNQHTRKEPPGMHESERQLSHNSEVFRQVSIVYQQQIKKPTNVYLKKIKKNFFEDAKSLAEGTIPQSVVLAIIIGIVCGIACYLYYSVLFFGLEYLWHTLPETYVVPNWDPSLHWLWIPLVCFTMCTLVGLTVVYMGEPGDLPYTISRVHCEAYIPMDHVSPMVFASMFSILGK